MPVRMSNAHRQDLEEILWPIFTRGVTARQTAINRLMERLEIDPENMGLWGSNSAENNFRGLFTNLNGTDSFLTMIAEIVHTKLSSQDIGDIEAVRGLLSPYGYTIQTSNRSVNVAPLTQAASVQQRQADRSWMEQNVPAESMRYVNSALERLGRGEWQDALEHSRLALEVLTVNSDFSGGLTELIQQNIIQEGQSTSRKRDAELLRAVYGFDSTYGAHGSGQMDATEERARMGFFQTEEAIIFLSKKIQAARRAGATLSQWR